MRIYVPGLLAFSFIFSAFLTAAEIKGKIVDPSGAAIPNAQVSVVSRVGVEGRTVSAASGAFELNIAKIAGQNLVVTAAGFDTKTVPLDASSTIQLEIAPVVDSISVAGSAMDVLASRQGGSVSVITREEVRERNEPFALDLLT